MGSPAMKKVRMRHEFEQDRISRLPDELIHKVVSFVDAKVALHTSVLSKRWKLIWTTLPYLNIGKYEHSSPQNTYNFIRHVLSNRNHQSNISTLKLCVRKSNPPGPFPEDFIDYAIEHDVQDLSVKILNRHDPCKLSTFNSTTLKKLTLEIKLGAVASQSDCWHLPALTYLCLVDPVLLPPFSFMDLHHKLPGSCFTCLPALKTLCLENWDLSISSFDFSLPKLRTLRLCGCRKLPVKFWNFPALVSLELKDVDFPKNVRDIFPTLVNLQSLTIYLTRSFMEKHHSIICPQLLNLNVKISYNASPHGSIKVLAPKLCNFTSFGILSITFEAPELENVNIKLHGWFGSMDWIHKKKYYRPLTNMLSGLGNAKNLTFDSDVIEALSAAEFLASLPSPFYKLKIVKVPPGYNESSMSSALTSYILGGSPNATIGTSLLQSNQTVTVSMTAQNAVLQEPLADSTNDLDDSQYVHQTPTVGTVDVNVQEEHVMGDVVGDADTVRHITVPIEEKGKERLSSSVRNRDFGLWQGHEVNSEFVCLLDRIMDKYPETFEHFTAKNKKLCTRNLNILCTSLNDFNKLSMTEIDSEIIAEYRIYLLSCRIGDLMLVGP
ncbi:FBD-associated F-box protein At3g52670-like [Apium graveolens]|uniref:FBD-associated F-box protein At3g52670-like n=1 Tax=Apium graveolens TaxID=4045 RepID=UPI003D78E39C